MRFFFQKKNQTELKQLFQISASGEINQLTQLKQNGKNYLLLARSHQQIDVLSLEKRMLVDHYDLNFNFLDLSVTKTLKVVVQTSGGKFSVLYLNSDEKLVFEREIGGEGMIGSLPIVKAFIHND